ncbi:MAG: phosphoenolpyruvate--protein phosphotransferase [Alphaproteobacteria bacterium]|nr:phosphoenolpyruvate--protein phosphotransferase [Alphaproteobacteria bacterium]
MSNLILVAPIQGWVAALDEVPDPVFSERILGDGLAIDPTGAMLRAPCDGVMISSAKHAVTLHAANGAEILIHIGLETVALGGQGFISLVREGKAIKAGDPLLTFDLEFLAARVKSLISPIVVTNGEAFKIVRRSHDCEVAVGDFLMELQPVDSAVAAERSAGSESRDVVVPLTLGIHARPAAMLSNCAKRFSSDVTLSLRGRNANAKSVAALMSLGVGFNDAVSVAAKGADAEQAVAAVVDLIGAGLGDGVVPSQAAPAQPNKEKAAPAVDGQNVVRGVRAAPGIALGRAVHFHVTEISVPEAGKGIARETEEFHRALGEARLRIEASSSSGDRQRRDILSAHLALLDDPELHGAARQHIENGKSAGFAWRQAIRSFAGTLKASDNVRMQERASDLLDLERQFLAVLTGANPGRNIDLPENAILIAEELLPSDLVSLDAAKIAGFVTSRGGPTSHIAILASGMNVPAVVGAGPAVRLVAEGTEVLLDADEGLLYLRPDSAAVAAARATFAVQSHQRTDAMATAGEKCRTADGTRIEILANLGAGAPEAAAALHMGAEGCGLLRTEFLFLDRNAPPSEDEQYQQYQAVADALDGRPFTLRTFDIGGDKPVRYLAFPPEENPALGLRGVRAGLLWPDLLRAQFGAIIRVKPAGRCKIMLPMIVSLGEFVAARAILDAMCEERNVAARIPLGVMIETPSSAVLADQLSREADFLSIGTNDLTQYVLAIDRGHRQLADQFDALHPAVLRLIAKAADSARAVGKPIGVCGGLATDPLATPILLGLGIGELSVPPPAIPNLKAAVHALAMTDCRAAARHVLTLESPGAVRAYVRASIISSKRGIGP